MNLGAQQPPARLPEPVHKRPQTSTRRSGQFPRPPNPKPSRQGNRSPCVPGSDGLRREPAGPRTSIPHGRLARTTATQPPAQLNEAAN